MTHNTKAREIADRYWQAEAGEVQDLAAEIVALMEAERERCIAELQDWFGDENHAVNAIAQAIRKGE